MTGQVKEEVKALKCRDLENMVMSLYFSLKVMGSPSVYFNTIALAVGWRIGGGKHEWKDKQEPLTEVRVGDGTGLLSWSQ